MAATFLEASVSPLGTAGLLQEFLPPMEQVPLPDVSSAPILLPGGGFSILRGRGRGWHLTGAPGRACPTPTTPHCRPVPPRPLLSVQVPGSCLWPPPFPFCTLLAMSRRAVFQPPSSASSLLAHPQRGFWFLLPSSQSCSLEDWGPASTPTLASALAAHATCPVFPWFQLSSAFFISPNTHPHPATRSCLCCPKVTPQTQNQPGSPPSELTTLWGHSCSGVYLPWQFAWPRRPALEAVEHAAAFPELGTP